MVVRDSVHLEGLEKPELDKKFQRTYVKQIEKAKNSIFGEISKEICNNPDNHAYVCQHYFQSKKTITKEKLGLWLDTVCTILDDFCLPWLVKADDDIEALNNEKITDQEKVIDLQNKVIQKQEEQLSEVKTTVATEMKSYSAVVSKSCTAALAPKKLQAAVQKVAESSERSKNIIVYGVDETAEEDLRSKVEEILVEIDEKPVIESCTRVGTKKEESVRPVRFSLNSSAHVQQILRNARKLRAKDGYGSIYICPDRSLEERRAYKKLVEELKVKRSMELDKVHVIRNNKVVSFNRGSSPEGSGMT